MVSAIAIGVEKVLFDRFRRKYPGLTRENFVGIIPVYSPDYEEMNRSRLFLKMVSEERERVHE